MTYLSLERTRQQTDLLATDLLPECPGCHELCPAGATVCAECATHLFVRQSNGVGRNSLDGMRAADAEEVTVPMEADEPRCTCGGNGICTYCDLQSYEPLPLEARGMMIALDMTEAALRRPANVVPIGRHSRRVS